jgi:hypothetical protein
MDQGRLNALQAMLCARLDELLGELGVTLHRTRKLYYGCCPVHGGDNPGALNLYQDGETRPGYWRCHTKGCERHFRRTIIGFVRGVLSRQKHDWAYLADPARRAAQKMADWKETVDWCCQFLGADIRKVEVDYGEVEKRLFVANMARFVRKPVEQGSGGLSRTDVRRHLAVPSAYFMDRGFSAEVLDRFDVGDYPAAGRPLSDRAVAPVYDPSHKLVVGFTGRSVLPVCGKCGRWHRPNELSRQERPGGLGADGEMVQPQVGPGRPPVRLLVRRAADSGHRRGRGRGGARGRLAAERGRGQQRGRPHGVQPVRRATGPPGNVWGDGRRRARGHGQGRATRPGTSSGRGCNGRSGSTSPS